MRARSVAAVAGSFGRCPDTALAQIERIVRLARRGGAQLVVLPECALGGYVGGPVSGPPPAFALDGPEVARIVHAAGPAVVCVGMVEAAPGGPHSTAVCVSGDGVLGVHRKVHLPPAEVGLFTPGGRFGAFDTPVGRLGMLVCYDKVFPEAARALALDGAETIASLAAWPACRERPARRLAADRQARHFDLLDRTRAVENQVVWVSANQTGRWGSLRFLGQAKVVDPEGAVLARTRARAGMALARVDARETVGRARRALSHLSDRRPGVYGPAEALIPSGGAEAPAVVRAPVGA